MRDATEGNHQIAGRDGTSVVVGEELPTFELPLTLQRLVMEAGVNRDFTPLHHDPEDTRSTGAPDAYANTIFIEAMLEAMLRNWMGDAGELKELHIKMISFNLAGTVVSAGGRVEDLEYGDGRCRVVVDLWMRSEETPTVEGTAVLSIPAPTSRFLEEDGQ